MLCEFTCVPCNIWNILLLKNYLLKFKFNRTSCIISGHQLKFRSVQLLSHVQLCNPMNRSTPGLPVHHQLPEFTQAHVHRVSASSVTPFSSCPQSFPKSGFFPISRLFPSGSQLIRASAVASVLPMNIQS